MLACWWAGDGSRSLQAFIYCLVLKFYTYNYRFCMISNCPDIRKGVSGAKFDAESDFEVHLAVAPQKPNQNSEKTIFRSENFAEKICSTSKNEMLGIV